MDTPVFALDASVFIEAARRYYAFDLSPGFWESLVHHAANKRIRSIDRIKKELERGKDQLATWAKDDFVNGFDSTDEPDVTESYGNIMIWVVAQDQFFDAAKAAFADDPDGWLVAYAKAKGCIVVTQEVPAPDAKKRVPIPNVCQAFNIQFVDTFEMLRKLGVRFK